MRHALLIVLTTVLTVGVQAQRSAVGAGSDATGAGGSMSYSIGQVGYTTVQGTGGTSSQGVQQSYEYLVLAVEPGIVTTSGLGVAPNPTSEGVQLTFTGTPGTAQRYLLMDAAGQVVRTANITTSMHIAMADLPCATYVLRVEGETPATFRIIKQ